MGTKSSEPRLYHNPSERRFEVCLAESHRKISGFGCCAVGEDDLVSLWQNAKTSGRRTVDEPKFSLAIPATLKPFEPSILRDHHGYGQVWMIGDPGTKTA